MALQKWVPGGKNIAVAWEDQQLKSLLKKAQKKGLKSAAKIVETRARANLAPHRRTGKTERGITSGAGKEWGYVKSEYPGYQVEHGHKARDKVTDVKGLDYMKAAMEQSKGEIVEELRKAAK